MTAGEAKKVRGGGKQKLLSRTICFIGTEISHGLLCWFADGWGIFLSGNFWREKLLKGANKPDEMSLILGLFCHVSVTG